MGTYLVRVEIFSGSASDYESLYESMSSLGLEKTVTFSDGGLQKLPTGTYIGNSPLSAESLRQKVSIFADSYSSRPASVFVCESGHWAAFLYSA